jgi:phosphopantothenoylcysteine decarboxylase/phosphopantothenate--cysteine ligase
MHTDGGSRGNPGPSAIGFSITDSNGTAVCEGGWPSGVGTNNEAEYRALIWGLENARALGVERIGVIADSQLMVNQVNGAYKVKNEGLKPLFLRVLDLRRLFESFSIAHVMRADNKRPDELLNQALDEGHPVGTFKVPFETETALFSFDVAGDATVGSSQTVTLDSPGEPMRTQGDDVPLDYVPAEAFEVFGEAEAVDVVLEAGTAPVEPSAPAAPETLPGDGSPRTILVGVTGCIAAYKTCEVIRCIQKTAPDVRVKVVMTEHATEFVGPATFRALTGEPVAVSLFDDAGEPIHHISLAKEADVMLIAPATANVLAKLAHGIADDLLTTTALATTAQLVVAPAMNVEMWRNPKTQESVAALERDGAIIVYPESGYLSCGDVGEGRLADPADIARAALRELELNRSLVGRRLLVTSGPTHEPIDPVRFIGNRSSGLQGTLIAREAARRGADVTLVTGPVSLPDPAGVRTIHVETAEQMLAAAREAFGDCDAAVFCAAVADFRPAHAATEKIKKVGEGDGSVELTIDLVRNPDILKTLAAGKGDRYVVGFAAETTDVLGYARGKLVSKNADLIVANDVSDPSLGFGTADNRVWLVNAEGERDTGVTSKAAIAGLVLDEIARALRC